MKIFLDYWKHLQYNVEIKFNEIFISQNNSFYSNNLYILLTFPYFRFFPTFIENNESMIWMTQYAELASGVM